MKQIKLFLITFALVLLSAACARQPRSELEPTARHDLTRIDLPTDLRPRAFGTSHYVGSPIGESTLLLVTLESGARTEISQSGGWGEAVLTETALYWIDNDGHVNEFRIDSETVTQLTEVTAERFALDGNGRWLVWQDKRNESESDSFYAADIYAYDLINREEVAVAIADGAQVQPSVWEDIVVWADNRSSTLHGEPLEGCANCPDNPFGIYSQNLVTGESVVLVEDGKHNTQPTISRGRAAWLTIGEGVRIMDLETGMVETTVAYRDGMRQPILSDDQLYYAVSQDCDVIMVDESGNEITRETGLYRTNIQTRQTVRLTDYTEPFVLVAPDTVLIAEGCMTGYEVVYLLRES